MGPATADLYATFTEEMVLATVSALMTDMDRGRGSRNQGSKSGNLWGSLAVRGGLASLP